MVLFGIWWDESLCPEEVPSGCVPCITFQETAYLLVLWLVPKSLNYIGLDPFMNWGQSTTVFPGNEFLPLCGKRDLLKCHCGISSLGESPVSAGKPGPENVYRNRPRIYPNTQGQRGERCQWMSGPGPCCTLSQFSEEDVLSRRTHTSVDFSWLCSGCCVMSVCRHSPSPVKALLSFNKLRLNKLEYTEGKIGFSLCHPRKFLKALE